MFCNKCGSKIPNNKEKCDVCGAMDEEEIEILSEEKTIIMNPIQADEIEFEEESVEEYEIDEEVEDDQDDQILIEQQIEEDDTPVIIESHTLVDDNKLKCEIEDKLTEESFRKEQQKKERLKKLSLFGVFAVVLLTLGLLTPKIFPSNGSKANMRMTLTDTAILINGKKYNIYDTYNKFKNAGWEMETDEKIVDSKAKTSIIEITHEKYKNNGILISMINQSDKEKDITECGVWSIKIDNYKKDYPIEFTLPGNIKTGSTIEEIEKAYGKLQKENIYRSEQSGYTKYHYKDENNSYLDLVVYDDIGLRAFTYMRY